MNETDIRNYAALMQELSLTGIEITEGDKSIRLERGVQAETRAMPAASPAAQVPPAAQGAEAADGTFSVKSPLVGMFYAAPAEDAEPYVKLGDAVKKGQALCIVEAMKLMNEILAEEDGVIAEICVTNGQMVEYGTELFRIRR